MLFGTKPSSEQITKDDADEGLMPKNALAKATGNGVHELTSLFLFIWYAAISVAFY